MNNEPVRQGDLFVLELCSPLAETGMPIKRIVLVALQDFSLESIMSRYLKSKLRKKRELCDFALEYNYHFFYQWGKKKGYFADVDAMKVISFSSANKASEATIDSLVKVDIYAEST